MSQCDPAVADQATIDDFCDNLWLEDGLAKNTLDAYRRDMRLFALWLTNQRGRSLYLADGDDLAAYIAAKHAGSKPTSANRRLAVLSRFYPIAPRQNRIRHVPFQHAKC